jgi:hypothetical protein
VLEDVKFKSVDIYGPGTTANKPDKLIHASGFVLVRRVVFQHINMITGALVKAARVLSADTAIELSWYGGMQPGFYSC